jgi:hypothetical protein
MVQGSGFRIYVRCAFYELTRGDPPPPRPRLGRRDVGRRVDCAGQGMSVRCCCHLHDLSAVRSMYRYVI